MPIVWLHPYQLRSLDTQIKITERHLSGAEAARSHVPLELAGRDSEVETNSSFNDENRAAVVASSATPPMQDVVSTVHQLRQSPITTTEFTAPATFHGVAGATSPSIL